MTSHGPPGPPLPPGGYGSGGYGPGGYGPGGYGPGGYGPGGPVVGQRPASPLWPIVVVTLVFALFGLIPTIIASNKASQQRESTGRYWIAFVLSLIGSAVLYTALVILLVVVVFAGTVAVVGAAADAVPSIATTRDPGYPSTTASGPGTTTGPAAPGATTGPCGYTPVPAGTPGLTAVPLPADPDPTPTGTRTWTFTTTAGAVVVELDAANAPCTVQSMVHLTDLGFFDGSPCPRSVDAGIFVLQCGDPTGTTAGGPTYTYGDEDLADAEYGPGVVAMANSGPDTNGSQFFFVTQSSQLAPNYTVFGKVTTGLDLLQKIVAAGNDGSNAAGGGAPRTPAELVTVTVA